MTLLLLLLLLLTPARAIAQDRFCPGSTGLGRLAGVVLLDSVPQPYAQLTFPSLNCIVPSDTNGKFTIAGLPLGPQRVRFSHFGVAPLDTILTIDSTGMTRVIRMSRYPPRELLASLPTVPTDTIVWQACFRLDAAARRMLNAPRSDACGTIRLPARILEGYAPRGFVGTHTVPFEQLGMQRGPKPGRVWASVIGDSALLTLDNFDGPLGTDTTDRAVVFTSDDGGISLIMPFLSETDTKRRWIQSMMMSNGYGTVRFRRDQ